MTVTAPAPAPRVIADVIPHKKARDLLLVLGGALFVGLSAQLALVIPPLSPVAYSMPTFAVLLVGASLGAVRGAISLGIYAVLGLVGVPWLANGNAAFNFGELSASFGYVVGFILAAALVGYLAERGWTRSAFDTALAMILGTVVIYVVGVPWLKFVTENPWSWAIEKGMSVFMLSDAIKIAIAAGLFPLVWRMLTNAGLAPRPDAAVVDEAAETEPTEADDDVIDLSEAVSEESVDVTDQTVDLTHQPQSEEAESTSDRG